jgi:hypothetical protein
MTTEIELRPAEEAVYDIVFRKAPHTMIHFELKPFTRCAKCVETARDIVAAAEPWLALKLTPCCTDVGDVVACNFDGNGEPCDTHERLYSHAENDHGRCGAECPRSAKGSR